jgi:hypothetical protein
MGAPELHRPVEPLQNTAGPEPGKNPANPLGKPGISIRNRPMQGTKIHA